jgi:hypothetical protein
MSASLIQDHAAAVYRQNMAFLESEYFHIYQKLILLETAIEEGNYQPQYILEYKDEGYFDVKSKLFDTYLYGENAIEYSQNLASFVTKSKEDKVVEGFYRHYFTSQDVVLAEKSDPVTSVDSCVLPVIDYTYRYIKDKKYLRHIKKFIFFGVGLGYHLPLVDQTIKEPAIYLVIEDDLELFRLSLFVTDYSKLKENNNQLFFSIADDSAEFRKIFDDFFDMGYLHNSYLKYLMFTDNYRQKFTEVQTFIVGQSHMGYTYNRLLNKYILSLKPIAEEYRFLNVSNYFQNSLFDEKPVLLLAAGPSLQKNIDWVKENHDKFIIIAVFMILPVLQKEGIEPDIVIHIDEQREPIQRVLEQVDLHKYTTESLFIFSPGIDIEWFQEYDLKDRSFMLEDRTHYKKDHGFLQAASVGETAYALSLIFNAKEIYLLGLDLAFDIESGKSHIDGHGGSMSMKNSSKNVSLRETFFHVKGNFTDEVVTNPLFYESILYANSFTKELKKPDQKVYNLSDGAYLEGILPVKTDEIDIRFEKIDKLCLLNDMQQLFMQHSSSLTQDEMELFKVRYDRILQKRKRLKKYLKQQYKTPEAFINGFIALSIDLSINDEEEIAQMEQILSVYLHYAGVYIAEFCNTAGVEYNKDILKNFQPIIVRQLDRIIEKYQKAIETII